MGLEFHQRLRQGFLDIAERNPKRCVIINAHDDIDDVQKNIRDIFASRFSLSKECA